MSAETYFYWKCEINIISFLQSCKAYTQINGKRENWINSSELAAICGDPFGTLSYSNAEQVLEIPQEQIESLSEVKEKDIAGRKTAESAKKWALWVYAAIRMERGSGQVAATSMNTQSISTRAATMPI